MLKKVMGLISQPRRNRRGLVRPMLPSTPSGKQVFNASQPSQEVPLYSGSVKQGGFVFVSGQGAHFEGDITLAHRARAR